MGSAGGADCEREGDDVAVAVVVAVVVDDG